MVTFWVGVCMFEGDADKKRFIEWNCDLGTYFYLVYVKNWLRKCRKCAWNVREAPVMTIVGKY